MSEQEVINLMESSQSAKEWDDNCDKVKDACGGYPNFWWATIVQSGLADKVLARWGHSTELTIVPLVDSEKNNS